MLQRSYFTCRKPFEISSVKSSYSQVSVHAVRVCDHERYACQKEVIAQRVLFVQMGGKGLYKAMGELDMLFNYIEDYMASHRRKN